MTLEITCSRPKRRTHAWPMVMKALDEIGYKGWGIAEQPGADSAEGLKDLSDRMDRILSS